MLLRSIGWLGRSAAGAVGGLLDVGGRRRRVWVGNGRAYIEVRGARGAKSGPLLQDLENRLCREPTVEWVTANAITGRITVRLPDPDALDEVLGLVESVETAHGTHRDRFGVDRPDLPGDREPLHHEVLALTADVLGLGLSTMARLGRLPPLPPHAGSVVAAVDSLPRLRGVIDRRLGAAGDLGLATVGAATQGFAQGPLGLVVDIGHRAGRFAEVRARNLGWSRREPELAGRVGAELEEDSARPVPLPSGPIERYADRATVLSLGAFVAGFAAFGNPFRAADLLVSGVPKAARLGREGFAEQLGRTLAEQGVLVMDDTVLRRLDRLDTVVLDADVLITNRVALGGLVALADLPRARVRREVAARFAPEAATTVIQHAGWSVGPLDAFQLPVPHGAVDSVRGLRRNGHVVLGVVHRDRLVGAVAVVNELDGLAVSLLRAAGEAGLEVVVAGGGPAARRQLGPHRFVPGGARLTASIRRLQREGRVVALVASGPAAALRAADCGIGLPRADSGDHWAADLVTGPGVGLAAVILSACRPARTVSRVSAELALGGSLLGGAMALIAPPFTAGRRATLGVNSAALAALANGAWIGWQSGSRPQPVAGPTVEWHALDRGAALSRLNSARHGLSAQEAHRRRRVAAVELLPPEARTTLLGAIGQELANPLTPLLYAGALLASATGSLTDAGLIAGVAGGNAMLGAVQRLRTERSLHRLAEWGEARVTVTRDGCAVRVPADQVVPGDVVSLVAGEVVPADCRVLETTGVEVDESALTGESLPVAKSAAACPGATLAEQRCMLFADTAVVAGSVTAVTVAVGRATVARRALAGVPDPPATGVEVRLERIMRTAIPLTLGAGALTAGLGVLRGGSLAVALQSGVALAVAAVPEGLPLLATVAQSAAARRLSAENALVRNPRTIEALGRVELLCFDKTGTLTAGRLTLQRLSDGETEQAVARLDEGHRGVLAVALRATQWCANGEALADPTDQAIVEAAECAQVGRDQGADGWRPVAELPFEAARGLHAVNGLHRSGGLLSVKGAPEVVLPRCTARRSAGRQAVLEPARRRKLGDQAARIARRGFRVLAVAEAEAAAADELNDVAVTGLCFRGFLAFADPVRPTAANAIRDLRAAGVEVAMITGDHASTAEAIAAELGLLDGGRVITGPDLDELSDDELVKELRSAAVFARVTPDHKVRIVECFQRVGRVVAMTGDGVNDAAAIRLAHVGIAIGRRGGAAARQAADVVVADERIETIVNALVEGRAMWASVRDALAILLGGNLGEAAFTVAATAITGRSPLSPRQLLLVNLLTDLLPAMTIALRPPTWTSTEQLLTEGPEASLGGRLERDIAVRAAATALGATGGWLLARPTGSARRARTVGLVALVGTQLGQTAVAGRRSPLVLTATAASAAVLAGVVQTPVISQFFGCTPLGPIGWAMGVGAAGGATAGSVVVPPLLRRIGERRRTAGDVTPCDYSAPTSRPWVPRSAAQDPVAAVASSATSRRNGTDPSAPGPSSSSA